MQMAYRIVRSAFVICIYLFVQFLFNHILRLWLGNRLQLMQSVAQCSSSRIETLTPS